MEILFLNAFMFFPEWPHSRWFTEAWARGEVYAPRFSFSTLTTEDITVRDYALVGARLLPGLRWEGHTWVSVVPGGHATAGLALSKGNFGIVAEPGFLWGRDALGIKAWDTGSTGFLPSGEVSAGFSRLGVAARIGNLALYFGRLRRFWSPLAMSGPPTDGLGAAYVNGAFSFSYLLVALDDYVADTVAWFKEGWLEPGDRLHRFFIGKRVEWAPSGNLTLYLCEGDIYATRGSLPRLAALNPLMSMYVYQWVAQDDNNAVWSLGGAWRRPGLFALFWEILVDDFQFNPSYRDTVPPDLGFYLESIVCPGRLYADLSGLAVTSWTYNNTRKWDRYTLWGTCLGPEEGPDLLKLSGETGIHLSEWLDLGLGYSGTWKGATNLDTPNPALGEYPETWFLRSPVAQTSLFFGKTSLARAGMWLELAGGGGSYPFARFSTGALLPW